jgi:hypothetical protein
MARPARSLQARRGNEHRRRDGNRGLQGRRRGGRYVGRRPGRDHGRLLPPGDRRADEHRRKAIVGHGEVGDGHHVFRDLVVVHPNVVDELPLLRFEPLGRRGHGLDRQPSLRMLRLDRGKRLGGGIHRGRPRLERLVPSRERAVDRPHTAGGHAVGEDRFEVRLVGGDERPIDGPRERFTGRQAHEIDELLLGRDERRLGCGPLRPGLGHEGVEHGAILRRRARRHQLEAFDAGGRLAQGRECGADLPIRLRDPQPAGSVARPLERLEQGERPLVQRAAGVGREGLEQFAEQGGSLRCSRRGRGLILRSGRGGGWFDDDRHGAIGRHLARGCARHGGILRAHERHSRHEAGSKGHDETRRGVHMGQSPVPVGSHRTECQSTPTVGCGLPPGTVVSLLQKAPGGSPGVWRTRR